MGFRPQSRRLARVEAVGPNEALEKLGNSPRVPGMINC